MSWLAAVLKVIAKTSSWVCVQSISLPIRAMALSRGRPWLLPVSFVLLVAASPFFVVGWMAYAIAGIAALAHHSVRMRMVAAAGSEAVPVVEADITLLPTEESGRRDPLVRTENAHYRPHIVLGDLGDRQAIVGGRRYLGVEIFYDREVIRPGESAPVSMRLMYWPAWGYQKVVPGATFTIREGATVVGYGTIRSRRDPY